MFKKKKEEEDFVQYQVNDDFISGDEVDWDNVLNSSESKKKKRRKSIKTQNKGSDETYKEEIDFDFTEENKTTKPVGIRINIKVFIGIVFYLFCCIIGGIITTYDSNSTPQVINVELREQRRAFNKIESDYKDLYNIIAQVNSIDSSLEEASLNDSFNYAVKYKDIISIVEERKTEVSGATYSEDYKFMREIATAIYKSLNQYLTLMSNGMSSQNSTYIKQASEYKVKYKAQFEKYTSNINQFKEQVKLN